MSNEHAMVVTDVGKRNWRRRSGTAREKVSARPGPGTVRVPFVAHKPSVTFE
jgi:hypothetical protein